jgi:hypothetical protein
LWNVVVDCETWMNERVSAGHQGEEEPASVTKKMEARGRRKKSSGSERLCQGTLEGKRLGRGENRACVKSNYRI